MGWIGILKEVGVGCLFGTVGTRNYYAKIPPLHGLRNGSTFYFTILFQIFPCFGLVTVLVPKGICLVLGHHKHLEFYWHLTIVRNHDRGLCYYGERCAANDFSLLFALNYVGSQTG